MNRIIYYLMIFLFSVGISIGITNNIIDVMFVIAGAIVYMITFFYIKQLIKSSLWISIARSQLYL